MSKSSLSAQTPLAGVQLHIGSVHLKEVTDRAIVSIATPKGSESALGHSLESHFKAAYPKSGQFTQSTLWNTQFLSLQADMIFAVFDYTGDHASKMIASKIDEVAYLSDQSDSWAMLEVSGENIKCVLRRLCPLDLHQTTFPVGSVARTVMEHLGVIIMCTDDNHYILLSPTSSAKSFMHALQTSAQYCE